MAPAITVRNGSVMSSPRGQVCPLRTIHTPFERPVRPGPLGGAPRPVGRVGQVRAPAPSPRDPRGLPQRLEQQIAILRRGLLVALLDRVAQPRQVLRGVARDESGRVDLVPEPGPARQPLGRRQRPLLAEQRAVDAPRRAGAATAVEFVTRQQLVDRRLERRRRVAPMLRRVEKDAEIDLSRSLRTLLHRLQLLDVRTPRPRSRSSGTGRCPRWRAAAR